MIRTSHWTFYFLLGKNIYTRGKKSLTVHSFCSVLEPDDVWLVRPTLFDLVVFWECPAGGKKLSFQIKEKYFSIQLLKCDMFAIFQCPGLVPPFRLSFRSISPHTHTFSAMISTMHPSLYNINTKKENTNNHLSLFMNTLQTFTRGPLVRIYLLGYIFF